MNQEKWAEMHKGSTQARPRPLWKTSLAGFGLLGLVLATTLVVLKKAEASPAHRKPELKSWIGRFAQLPLSFEVNRGQTDSRVKYLAQGLGYTLFLTPHEAVVALHRGKYGRAAHSAQSAADLYLKLLGASPAVRVTGENQLRGYSNYFIGNNPREWHTHVPNYARVRYHQIYPGIDLVYYGRRGQLENDFMLSPGANPQSIRIGLKGVESMHVDRAGDLVLNVSGGKVYLRRPHAYQGGGPARRKVAVNYVLRAGNQVGFSVGAYNHKQKLVIDPVLAYSTYLGGSGGDIGYGIAVDSSSGDAYITGITNSTNFPTSSAYSTTSAGDSDAFVAKIDPAGSPTSTTTPQLVYSTYLGGSGSDSGNAIAVNAGGDAFVTGSTTSSDFPVTSGVFQSAYGGSGDAFVTQLSSTGSSLVYSSFLGGTEADDGLGITLDSSNNAYVTGSTQSADLKTTLNAWQPNNAGSSDAFVAEINFSGSQLTYLTYLGGSQADVGQSIQVDSSSGNVYVAGYTFSPDFPLQGPLQGALGGTVNAFVTELSIGSSSTTLQFSTYFGGSADDRAYGLALDRNGNVYITGSSTSPNFPTSVGAYQVTNHGQSDAFVAEIKPSGPTLVYSTLLGGSGTEQANGIAVDTSGDAYVTGYTDSSDFPTQNPIQSVLGINGGSACGSSACSDAFVTEVNPTGTGLVESTYLGGSGADFGQAIALGSSGNVYVTGSTSSTNFPAIAGTYPAYSSSLTGVAGNAFVAEISSANAPGIAINPASVDFGNVTENVRSAVETVQIINEGTSALNITKISFTETDSSGNTADFAETDNCVGTVAASGGTCTINITFTPRSLSLETGTFSIDDNAAGSPQTISVQGTGVTAATAVTLSPSSLTFGNITVGDVSSAQTVTITNTGTQTLNITGISASGDFSQTNTCGSLQNVLNVGQSCSISVTFSPTVSGARSGTVSISDNATGSPQSVALTGTGVAVFKMSSPSPNVSVLIGNTTATVKVTASAPSSFTGSITLSCPSGLTCSFSPTSIFAGQTSTLTISDLTTSMANPYAFAVTGTSGSQSATVNMNLLFADYALSATPSLNTIVAGSPAHYTISLSTINGFNKAVQLACGSGMPPGATCTFSSSSVTPSGGSASVKLTIQTSKNGMVVPPPAVPPGAVPYLMIALFALIVFLAWTLARKRKLVPSTAGRRWLRVQVCMLCLLIFSEVFLGSCRTNPSSTSGTTTGNYSITINGTLSSDSSVVRSTIINLSVT